MDFLSKKLHTSDSCQGLMAIIYRQSNQITCITITIASNQSNSYFFDVRLQSESGSVRNPSSIRKLNQYSVKTTVQVQILVSAGDARCKGREMWGGHWSVMEMHRHLKLHLKDMISRVYNQIMIPCLSDGVTLYVVALVPLFEEFGLSYRQHLSIIWKTDLPGRPRHFSTKDRPVWRGTSVI